MKKYFLIYLILMMVSFASCNQKEDLLTPSYKDADGPRVSALIDMADTILPISKYKVDYGVAILHEYDDILDFKFGLYEVKVRNLWNNFMVTQYRKDSVVTTNPITGLKTKSWANTREFALRYLRDSVLRYFKDSIQFNGKTYTNCQANKKYLPRKILISNKLEAINGDTPTDNFINESDYPEKNMAIGNSYMYMFAIDSGVVARQNAVVKMEIRNQKLYSFICNMIENNNLYAQIPAEFSKPVEHLYDFVVDSIADFTDTINQFMPPEIISKKKVLTHFNPRWYIKLGMAITAKSPYTQTSDVTLVYDKRLPVNKSCKFPNAQSDFRNFVNIMIFQTPTSPAGNNNGYIESYYLNPDNTIFKARMKIAIDLMLSWGIDVIAINPELKKFYN